MGELASSTSFGCCSGGVVGSDGKCQQACALAGQPASSQPGGCCSGVVADSNGMCQLACAVIGESASSQPGGCCAGTAPGTNGICSLACATAGQLSSSQPGGCCGGAIANAQGMCEKDCSSGGPGCEPPPPPVGEPKDIVFSGCPDTVNVGSNPPCSATVVDANGTAIPDAVAAVTADPAAVCKMLNGNIVTFNLGSCSITATYKTLSKSKSMSVTPHGLKIEPASLSLGIGGKTGGFGLKIVDSSGFVLDAPASLSVEWTLSAATCGTLGDSKGPAAVFTSAATMADKKCSTTVTAKVMGVTTTATVNVRKPTLKIVFPSKGLIFQASGVGTNAQLLINATVDMPVDKISLSLNGASRTETRECPDAGSGSGEIIGCERLMTTTARPGRYTASASGPWDSRDQVEFFVFGPPSITKMRVLPPKEGSRHMVDTPIIIEVSAQDHPDNMGMANDGINLPSPIEPGLRWLRVTEGSNLVEEGQNLGRTVTDRTINWRASIPGNYTFCARALNTVGMASVDGSLDPKSGGSCASVQVFAKTSEPIVTMLEPASFRVIAANTSITLRADAKALFGKKITRVDFYERKTVNNVLTDVKLGTDFEAPYQWAWTSVPAGMHNIFAAATDDGALQNKVEVGSSTVISLLANVPPKVQILSPSAGATLSGSTEIPVKVSAEDADGALYQLELYAGEQLIGVANNLPAGPVTRTFTWASAPAGTYNLIARATDDQRFTTDSAPLPITVTGSISTNPPLQPSVPQLLPVLRSVNPSTLQAGGGSQEIEVNGDSFQRGYSILWNGSPRTTTFISGSVMRAAISAADLRNPTTAQLQIRDNISGTLSAETVELFVRNPSPAMGIVTPLVVVMGETSTMTVTGAHFNATSMVRFGATLFKPMVDSPTSLRVVIPGSAIKTAGSVMLRVENPGPGGGASTAFPILVNQPTAQLSGLSRSAAAVGETSVPVSVFGANFDPTSQVFVNGQTVATKFVSPTEVSVTLASKQLASAQTARIDVETSVGFSDDPLRFDVQKLSRVELSASQLTVPLGTTQKVDLIARDENGQFINIDIPLNVKVDIEGSLRTQNSRLEASSRGRLTAAPGRQSAGESSTSRTLSLASADWGLPPGVYPARITVTDAGGNSASTTISLTVLASSLGSAIVYPNPWRSDRDSDIGVTFGNLSAGATVRIFDVAGRWVKTLNASGPTVEWKPLHNDSGDRAESGLYLYVAEDANGDRRRGKFVIIR